MVYLEYCTGRQELLEKVKLERVSSGAERERLTKEIEEAAEKLREWDTHYFPRYWKEFHGVFDF